jgi:hypothetical protein
VLACTWTVLVQASKPATSYWAAQAPASRRRRTSRDPYDRSRPETATATQVVTVHSLGSASEVDGDHYRCGQFHNFQGCCPISIGLTRPPESKACMTPAIPSRASPRSSSKSCAGGWMVSNPNPSLSRSANCAWPDVARAVSVTTQDVSAHWVPLIGRSDPTDLLVAQELRAALAAVKPAVR